MHNKNIYVKLSRSHSNPQDFEHYIPLDATKLTWKNNNNVLIYQNGVSYSQKLSDNVTSVYDVKSVEIIITENYNYFKLNNVAFLANQKFNVGKQLTFNSNVAKKYHITFRYYGILLTDAKNSGFYIRVCHERYSDCYDSDLSSDNQQCKTCSNNF